MSTVHVRRIKFPLPRTEGLVKPHITDIVSAVGQVGINVSALVAEAATNRNCIGSTNDCISSGSSAKLRVYKVNQASSRQ